MPADAVTDTIVIAAVDKAHTNPVYEGTKAEAYLSPSKRKPLHISDSSLYHVTSDPTARYLVETDPAYADRKPSCPQTTSSAGCSMTRRNSKTSGRRLL